MASLVNYIKHIKNNRIQCFSNASKNLKRGRTFHKARIAMIKKKKRQKTHCKKLNNRHLSPVNNRDNAICISKINIMLDVKCNDNSTGYKISPLVMSYFNDN